MAIDDKVVVEDYISLINKFEENMDLFTEKEIAAFAGLISFNNFPGTKGDKKYLIIIRVEKFLTDHIYNEEDIE